MFDVRIGPMNPVNDVMNGGRKSLTGETDGYKSFLSRQMPTSRMFLKRTAKGIFTMPVLGIPLWLFFDGQDCRPSNLRNVKHSSARCFGLSRRIRVNTSVFDGRFIIIRYSPFTATVDVMRMTKLVVCRSTPVGANVICLLFLTLNKFLKAE